MADIAAAPHATSNSLDPLKSAIGTTKTPTADAIILTPSTSTNPRLGLVEDDSIDEDTISFEDMTYDEMSRKIEQNFHQLSAMLNGGFGASASGSGSPTTLDSFRAVADSDFDDEEQIVNNDNLTTEEKRMRITKIFRRAASNGDIPKIQEMVNNSTLKPLIDLNAKDEDGTTPLIYAACFGHAEVAFALLSAGAEVDAQDKFGWSALMWATNNNHENLVRVLLDHGASATAKTAKGRNAFDFVTKDNSKMTEILSYNPRDSMSSNSSYGIRIEGDDNFLPSSGLDGFEQYMQEERDRQRKLMENATVSLDIDLGDLALNGNGYEDDEDEDDEDEENMFMWDRCLPDQMFVFSSEDLTHILDVVVKKIRVPVRTKAEILIPANVIFLSARFAHYFSSEELLEELLQGALDRMSKAINRKPDDMSLLAFWIANLTQLLFYLKKDTGLVVATAEYQLRLSELIHETYQLLVRDAQRRIDKILDAAMLDHDQIPGLDDVRFGDEWRFFRKDRRKSPTKTSAFENYGSTTMKRTSSGSTLQGTGPVKGPPPRHRPLSPRSITTLLSSTLFVLQTYEVHPTIILQVIAQYFYYIASELFNRILTTKKLLCRSKALQIRMNLSYIEDWLRYNHLPSTLTSHLSPLIQLLQLLQILSQLKDLSQFVDTLRKLDVLNPVQLKRVILNYRYEVNEPKVPEEIEKYAIQIADDTIKAKAVQRKSMDTFRSKASRSSLSRADSLRSINSKWESSGSNMSPSPNGRATPDLDSISETAPILDRVTAALEATNFVGFRDDDEDDTGEQDIVELKDSKFMLPFSIPTNWMMAPGGWSLLSKKSDDTVAGGDAAASVDERDEATRKNRRDKEVTPHIPEDWMEKLDRNHRDI